MNGENSQETYHLHAFNCIIKCVLSILTAIFPGEPGLAGFIATKDNGSGGDN